MKKYLMLLLGVGLVFSMGMAKKPADLPAGVTTDAAPEAAETAKEKAIDFKLSDLDGKEVTLSSFQGKKNVWVVFSATWCGFCIKEIPSLIEYATSFKGKDFVILDIDLKESPEKVSAFVKDHKINYTVLLDRDGKVSNNYSVLGIPTNIIVDKSGNVVYNGNEMPPKELIAKLLKK